MVGGMVAGIVPPFCYEPAHLRLSPPTAAAAQYWRVDHVQPRPCLRAGRGRRRDLCDDHGVMLTLSRRDVSESPARCPPSRAVTPCTAVPARTISMRRTRR